MDGASKSTVRLPFMATLEGSTEAASDAALKHAACELYFTDRSRPPSMPFLAYGKPFLKTTV